MMPRYPIYVPSKNRLETSMTANFLLEDGVPFHIVVEPQEADAYKGKFGEDRVLVLPENDQGLHYARNWIKAHATEAGYKRHWQIDDNCKMMRRMWKGKRIRCNAGVALAVIEDLADRYKNVAIIGPNYTMFAMRPMGGILPHFLTNCHVYSCSLILNEIPFKWRSRYNDDTDLCLQVLSGGYCTILCNVFLIDKQRTMLQAGGNTPIYQCDGRLYMAQDLARRWPRIVKISRKWGRPQHVVNWHKFKTPLKLREDFVPPTEPNEYGMKLKKQ